MAGVHYMLSCSLIGHSSDVRALAAFNDGCLVTASRDTTAKLWEPNQGERFYYACKVTYEGHSGYVTSVCVLNPNASEPAGLVITGCRDSRIRIFKRNESTAFKMLSEHTDTVSCLAVSSVLVSGSWDHTAKVWVDYEVCHNLKGHLGPLWAVAFVPGNSDSPRILTASADKLIKLWKNGKEEVTYAGHTDCVRGLAVSGSDYFYSCSNDASVRFWSTSGQCMATYYGHSSFIYDIGCFEVDRGGGFTTGGEDKTLRLWNRDGEPRQSIPVPAQSVWAVCILPTGDIAIGTSDGICYVFSQASDRAAPEEEIQQFVRSVAESKIHAEDVGGIKKTDLPDKTFLLAPGKRDGQTVMVRDGSKVMCYTWDGAKMQWNAMGEVVGGAGGSATTSGKVLYEGREYDYLFDVELDTGLSIKLPYNRGEDPWMVSQNFIHKHDLPQDYLDQIASFLVKNVPDASIAIGNGYSDPFTGGSRYVPSGSDSGRDCPLNVDPFTGTGRYKPPGPSPQSHTPEFTSPFFPQLDTISFDACNKDGIRSKLIESNSALSDALSEADVDELINAICSESVSSTALSALEHGLQWPSDKVWPVLDILRMVLLQKKNQEMLQAKNKWDDLYSLLCGLAKPSNTAPTRLLALRCLTNMAAHCPGQNVLHMFCSNLMTLITSATPFQNKNIEIATASVVMNMCVMLQSSTTEHKHQALGGAGNLCLSVTDPEAQFRALVGIGTILVKDAESRAFCQTINLKQVLQRLAATEEPKKVGECARHILPLL